MKRPLGVSLISLYYIFGAGVLIVSAIFFDVNADEFGISDRFGLPGIPEKLFRIILAIVYLIIVYGYMSLKRWGFWLMIIFSLGFGLISYILLLSYNQQQPFMGNLIWSFIVLFYTLYVRKSFIPINEN